MNQIIKFLASLNQLTQLVLVGLMLFLAAYVMGSWGKDTTIEKYNALYKQYQEQVKLTTKTSDSLNKIIKLRMDSAKVDSIKAAKQTTKIDSLKHAVGKFETAKGRLESEIDSLKKLQPDTTKISLKKDTIISILRADSSTMAKAIVELEKRDTSRVRELKQTKLSLSDAILRGNKLQAKLDSLPKPPTDPDKWLFGLVKKPSRVVVGAVSATAGIIAGVYLTR